MEASAIDFVYNRLTDFTLDQPAQAALKLAYLAREIVVSPHPRAHALYADKRNLTLLCDEAFLRQTGITDDAISTLLAAIPRTEIMTAGNRPALWAKRRQLFFKPAAGFGSKAVYRGDKLTKRVWDDMTKGTYVAQALVPPSERHMADTPTATALKADVRNYAYAGAGQACRGAPVSRADHELSHARRRIRAGIHGNAMNKLTERQPCHPSCPPLRVKAGRWGTGTRPPCSFNGGSVRPVCCTVMVRAISP